MESENSLLHFLIVDLMILGCFSIACHGFLSIRRHVRLLQTGKRTEAIIADVKVEVGDECPDEYVYVFYFFSESGEKITCMSQNFRRNPFDLGEKVYVYYNPSNLQEAHIESWAFLSVALSEIFVGGLLAIIFLLGTFG